MPLQSKTSRPSTTIEFDELYESISTARHSGNRSSRRCCPICDGEGTWTFSKNDVKVLDCSRCQHRYADLHPQENHTAEFYDDDYFTDGADGYVNYIGDGPLVQQRGVWYADLLKVHGVRTGEMLDVGAAAGFFLKGMIESGWSGTGLEPNAGMAQHACRETGVEVRTGTLESLRLNEQFDLISIIQVVAHLFDPAEAFRKAAMHTRIDGHWIVETWNYRSISARLFGQLWHEYSPPRTLHWFSPASIEKLAAFYGMELVASGRPDKFITGEHAKSLVEHATESSVIAKAVTSPLKLIPDGLKIPYLADDLNWFLFRRVG